MVVMKHNRISEKEREIWKDTRILLEVTFLPSLILWSVVVVYQLVTFLTCMHSKSLK